MQQMSTTSLFITLISAIAISNTEGFNFIGCWRGWTKFNNESSHESMRDTFGPVFNNFINIPVENRTTLCSNQATEKQLDYFVMTSDGCRGDVHTKLTYRKYGSTDGCSFDAPYVGQVYAAYSEDLLSESDAIVTKKKIPELSSKRSKISEYIAKKNNAIQPEIVKKDIILMNKVFTKLYGNDIEYFEQPKVFNSYPDNEHFNAYYAGESDDVTWQKVMENEADATPKHNLFENGYFEHPLRKPNGHNNWNCFGEIVHGQAGVISRTSDHKHDGKYAGACSHRVGFHAGPGQFVGHAVQGGRAYKIHGWTKLLNASKDDFDKIELWIRYQGNDVKNNTETRLVLAKRDKFNKNDDWQEWNAQFALPAHKPGFRYVQIYFKGPKYHVNILIDGMELNELPLEEDWLEQTKAKTELLRKRHATIRINFDPAFISKEQLKTIRVKVTQKQHHFGFGSAVHHRHLEDYPAYRNFFLRNFEWGVPENAMKWTEMESKKGAKKHCWMDSFVSTLNKYNVSMRGHCIFWEVDSETPKWLNKLDKKHLLKAVKQRLDDTVCKYRSKIAHWDVNNEMLHGSYFADRLGHSIRDWMFKAVHKDDKHSRLFVNDFGVVADGIFTQSYLEQIMGFKKRGAPLHGVGVQGHFVGWTHPSILKERFDIIGKAGIPIWITEMDILEHDETKRAKSLEYIMRVAFAHPSVAGIILWAFWSKSAWRGADTALINDEFDLNKAGKRYLDLREEWTTRLTLKPSSVHEGSCEFKFRGYHGIYNITVLFPDGQKITTEINLTPKKQPLIVEINTEITTD